MDRVMETLRADSGSHFEPRLLEHFVRILPEILSIKQEWEERDAD